MFITLEGPEGSGKSSHIAPLAEELRQRGYDVVITREPGGTPIGDEIREVILSLKNTDMHATTEILLFQAGRAQHVHQLIIPSLEAGKIVLCDRYADSTLAYQGYGHQTDLGKLSQMIEFATGGLQPDLTLLLDVDVSVGLSRRSSAEDDSWNRLDAKAKDFHQRVRDGYHRMVSQQPERWVVIDAGQPLEKVQADILAVVLGKLAQQIK